MDASIEIDVANEVSDGFKEVFDVARTAKNTLFTYKDTPFQIVFGSNGRFRRVFAILDLGTPLPEVFRKELSIRGIVLKANLPKKLLAKPG